MIRENGDNKRLENERRTGDFEDHDGWIFFFLLGGEGRGEG